VFVRGVWTGLGQGLDKKADSTRNIEIKEFCFD